MYRVIYLTGRDMTERGGGDYRILSDAQAAIDGLIGQCWDAWIEQLGDHGFRVVDAPRIGRLSEALPS
jgi:hypothetical protein